MGRFKKFEKAIKMIREGIGDGSPVVDFMQRRDAAAAEFAAKQPAAFKKGDIVTVAGEDGSAWKVVEARSSVKSLKPEDDEDESGWEPHWEYDLVTADGEPNAGSVGYWRDGISRMTAPESDLEFVASSEEVLDAIRTYCCETNGLEPEAVLAALAAKG